MLWGLFRRVAPSPASKCLDESYDGRPADLLSLMTEGPTGEQSTRCVVFG